MYQFSFVWMIFTTHESPIHLVKRNKNEKALRALHRFKSTEASAQVHYEEIVSKNNDTKDTNMFTRCVDSKVWKPFLIVTSLQIVQQFAMMAVFNKYIVAIFQDTFQANNILKPSDNLCAKQYEPYLAAVLIGITRLVSSLTLSLMVDQHRKRRIYLVSGRFSRLSPTDS
jgi:hypothetical protein